MHAYDGLCHVAISYDVGFILYAQMLDMSNPLLEFCQGLLTQVLITWTKLLTQDNIHTTSISHNFETQNTTHMQSNFPRMNAL